MITAGEVLYLMGMKGPSTWKSSTKKKCLSRICDKSEKCTDIVSYLCKNTADPVHAICQRD